MLIVLLKTKVILPVLTTEKLSQKISQNYCGYEWKEKEITYLDSFESFRQRNIQLAQWLNDKVDCRKNQVVMIGRKPFNKVHFLADFKRQSVEQV